MLEQNPEKAKLHSLAVAGNPDSFMIMLVH